MQTILAVDDELSVRESYRMILGGRYRMVLAESAGAAAKILQERHVDLVLLDLMMPGMSGIEFLACLEKQGVAIPVVVVTALGTVESAVRVMKHGARDYVMKPFDVDQLTLLVDRILREQQEKQELATFREMDRTGLESIIGGAPALLDALAKARQAMQVDSTVLILGETGTGKDVLARAIHYGGRRKEKPFVPVSCCAIPTTLVESELFGHVRGAFTGATDSRVGKMQVADGGSLFLDEIGEMPLDAQAKLLRVLQDGCFYPVGGTKQIEVDVRFICASNRDFTKAIQHGAFREDLFYRINVLPITMPALRNRREDIPRLTAHFVAKHGQRVNSEVREFSQRAMVRLLAYHWPGNVRELENTVERILVCHNQERTIQPEHLDSIIGPAKVQPLEVWGDLEGLPLEEATNRIEAHLIRKALERSNNVQSQAAEMLGTTRRILKYKMDQLGITPPGEPETLAS
ncbi:MAG: sigma-54-dependent Fis family transcriptional regulator [Candidatus Hydrogenedentes bacterium]|nr:sigma-54-dependent Fis family transcriptional regulator [Candidatus Hydrogenedentota bacterium]